MRSALFVLLSCLLCVVGVGGWWLWKRADDQASRSSRAAPPPAREVVELPSVDWDALASWARNNVALKGRDGEWESFDEILRGLGAFFDQLQDAAPDEPIDEERLALLMTGIGRFKGAEREQPGLIANALLEVARDPEAWARHLRTVGRSLMVAVYDTGRERRPILVEEMEQLERELREARGSDTRKLEAKRGQLQETIEAIDRLPVPSETARRNWDLVRVLFDKLSAGSRTR